MAQCPGTVHSIFQYHQFYEFFELAHERVVPILAVFLRSWKSLGHVGFLNMFASILYIFYCLMFQQSENTGKIVVVRLLRTQLKGRSGL